MMKHIIFTVHNLIEFSDIYSDTSGSLWHFKRDEPPDNIANPDFANNNLNSQSFKYKEALVGKTSCHVNPNSFVKNTKIFIPLKYLSNFWGSLEMPKINWKVYLELNWTEYCIFSSAGDSAKFKIIDAKLHVPIVTSCD